MSKNTSNECVNRGKKMFFEVNKRSRAMKITRKIFHTELPQIDLININHTLGTLSQGTFGR